MRLAVVLGLGGLLVACEAPRLSDQEVLTQALTRAAPLCDAVGIPETDPRRAECMLLATTQATNAIRQAEELQIADQRNRASAALLGLSNSLNTMSTNMAIQNAAQQPVRLQTSCTRIGNIVNCY